MRRVSRAVGRARTLLASAVLATVVSAAGLTQPGCVSACTCMPPQSLEFYVQDGSTVVLVGTVAGNDRFGRIDVARLFRGNLLARTLPIEGGDGAMCGVTLRPGVPMFVVAHLDQGTLRPSSCAPFVAVASPEGAAYLEQAEAAFGAGNVPEPGPDEAPAPESAPSFSPALALVLAIIAAVGLAVTVFGGLALVARRNQAAP